MVKILPGSSFFSPPYPLKLVIYEEEWKMSWCLPSAILLLLYLFSPRHTHTPPCQPLFPWGQWERHSSAQATAECASEGKGETDRILVLWIQNILQSCFAYSILAFA